MLETSIQKFFTLIRREEDRLRKENTDENKIKIDQNARKAEGEFLEKLKQLKQ